MIDLLISIEALQASIAEPQAWLTHAERAEGARWRNPKQYAQWQWGRVAAKQLLLTHGIGGQPVDIEILAGAKSRRPLVRLQGQPWKGMLSISHTDDLVYVAMARGRRLGCDVLDARELSAAFQQTWFVESERRWLNDRPSAAAGLWAAKEAVYKALNSGEGFAPHRIELQPNSQDRYRCRYRGQTLGGNYLIQTAERGNHVTAIAMFDEETDS